MTQYKGRAVKGPYALKFVIGSRILPTSGDLLVTTAYFVLIRTQVFGFQLSMKQNLDCAGVKVLLNGRQWSFLGTRLIFFFLE